MQHAAAKDAHLVLPTAIPGGRGRVDGKFSGNPTRVGAVEDPGAQSASQGPPGRSAENAPEQLSTGNGAHLSDPTRDAEPD